MPASDARTQHRTKGEGKPEALPSRLEGRLGLSVPREWWPSAPLLKSYEAAGFGWVQLHSPPAAVLRDARLCTGHAAATSVSLATTGLRAVVHAPGGLRAGTRDGDRALEGLLSYAAELGAAQVVYHALELPDAPASEDAARFETRSLATLAAVAERLEVTIAIENVCPVFPGPEPLSADPMALRALAQRISSPAVGLCVDAGHAHVIADLRHTGAERLIEPVLDAACAFHVHDNLGARWSPRTDIERGIDPLRLDLHLAPGQGTLPWAAVAPLLATHQAPLLLEVHPPHRPRASELVAGITELVAPAPAA